MSELDALWAFLVAAAVALLVTPLARVAHRIGAVDGPRERGLHDRPMPYLGGLAILAEVQREVETGEFEAVERPDGGRATGEFEAVGRR